jgi:transketolase
VAEVVVRNHPVPMEFIGVHETYAESGKPHELFERYGLTSNHINRAIDRVLKRKSGK